MKNKINFSYIFLFSFFTFCIFVMPLNAAELLDVQYEQISEKKGQVVVNTDEELSFKYMYLPGDNTRLVIDFLDTSYKLANKKTISQDGILRSIRFGRHLKPQKTRMVLDLDSSCKKDNYLLSKTDKQVVIDLDCSNQEIMAGNIEAPILPAVEAVAVVPVEPVLEIPPAIVNDNDVDHIFANDSDDQNQDENVEKSMASPVILKSISHEQVGDSQEMVVIHLTDFINPSLTAVDGDQLTVLCELSNVKIGEGVIKDIDVGGRFIDSIHSEPQDDGSTLISLYLDGAYTYDLNQVFYKKENVLTLVVHSN